MTTFISRDQITAWAMRTKINGPCSVLKRVEHNCCLVVLVQTTGKVEGTILLNR